MSTREYEKNIVKFLNEYLGNSLKEEIKKFSNGEYILGNSINKPLIKKQKHMRLENGIYSPIPDISVGPFAFLDYSFANWDVDNYIKLLRIDRVNRLIKSTEGNGQVLSNYNITDGNQNPRCLIAFELEKGNDKKHILGSITNCSIMGKVGIYIDYDTIRLDKFFRFVNEMIKREKASRYWFQNVIFISKDDFDEVLESLNEDSNLH